MSTAAITLDELVSELRRLGVDDAQKDSDGLTAVEWATVWKCTECTARRKLNVAKEHGLLRMGRKARECLNGAVSAVPCYSIVLPDKPSAKKAGKK
jgi:hypothetical protein